MTNVPLLTILLAVPAAGAIIVGAMVPRDSTRALKIGALITTIAAFVVSLLVWAGFSYGRTDLQFDENVSWFQAGSFAVRYHVGVDGISLLLVVLTTFLMVIAILGSWNVADRLKEYMVVMLALETGMIGVFIAADLFLFYVFWEATLIPMYLLIGIWGGPRRIYAAIKFILYTAFGSLLMLVAIVALARYLQPVPGAVASFDLAEIGNATIPSGLQAWLFGAFALAFAIKVPMFPLHTWLPDAHVEAPTAGSIILAGVLLKMGTYGFLRFCLPLFPNASREYMGLIAVFALIGIVYGALVALVQPDIKKLVAYSSVSHLGFVMLGLFALNFQGLQGGLLQMVNHGISTGALFLLVGMIYDRRHTRMIAEYGGLWKQMPLFSAFFLVVLLSSIALPFTNGFVGEFLILLGASNTQFSWAVVAATGMILSAAYMLWMYQRVFFGPMKNPANEGVPDLNTREILTLVPIVGLILAIGIYPKFFLDPTRATLAAVVNRVSPPAAAAQGIADCRLQIADCRPARAAEGRSGSVRQVLLAGSRPGLEPPGCQPAPPAGGFGSPVHGAFLRSPAVYTRTEPGRAHILTRGALPANLQSAICNLQSTTCALSGGAAQ